MSGMTPPPSSEDTAWVERNGFPPGTFDLPAAVPQPKIKKRQKLEPEGGSRLSLLFTQLPGLEAAKRDAEAALAAHKKQIQQEIARGTDPANLPDVFDIPADPYGAYPAYTLSAREGAWRLNTEAMKAEEPETYVRWAVKGEPYWELKRKQTNRVNRGRT